MQMKFIRCGLWLLLAAGTLVLAGNVMAEEQLDVVVDGGPVSFTVRGFADLQESVEQMPIHWLTLTRTAEDDGTALYYSLTDLSEGFPRDMVVVKTPYDSNWQAFAEGSDRWRWSSDAQICLLAAGDRQSQVQIALRGDVTLRAGTYSAVLSASNGPDIPIEITVLPYTVEMCIRDSISTVRLPTASSTHREERLAVTIVPRRIDGETRRIETEIALVYETPVSYTHLQWRG